MYYSWQVCVLLVVGLRFTGYTVLQLPAFCVVGLLPLAKLGSMIFTILLGEPKVTQLNVNCLHQATCHG